MSSPNGLLSRPNSDNDTPASNMSSYADITAKNGPKQTDAEKIPDAVPEIAHSDSGVHSLDSLNSDGPNIVPSYADQQKAAEEAEQLKKDAGAAADKVAKDAKNFADRAEKDLNRLEKDGEKKFKDIKKEAGKQYEQFADTAEQKYGEFKDAAGKNYESLKKEAKADAKKAKQAAQEGEQWAEKNKDNPVVIGNAVALVAIGGLLTVGGIRMHQQGTLTWKVAGTWAGIVGAFAVGDYFVSQYFFKRYPTKK